MGMLWYVYLLTCADDTLYCGITTDVDRRMAQHNGKLAGGARYTCARRPVELTACAAVPDRSSAASLEAHVKSLPKAQKVDALLQVAEGVPTQLQD